LSQEIAEEKEISGEYYTRDRKNGLAYDLAWTYIIRECENERQHLPQVLFMCRRKVIFLKQGASLRYFSIKCEDSGSDKDYMWPHMMKDFWKF
jgi:hypothetical protein